MTSIQEGLINLWIIDDDSGICIFDQEFGELPTKVNEDLIGGFLSAIRKFSQEVTGQNIQMIQLDQISLHVDASGRICFVAATSLDVKPKEIKKFLGKLQEKFVARYKDAIDESTLNNVSIFEEFAAEVEMEIGRESKYVTLFHPDPQVVKLRIDKARENFEMVKKGIMNHLSGILDKGVEASREAVQNLGLRFLGKNGKHRRKKQGNGENNGE